MQSEQEFWKSVDSGLYHQTTEELEEMLAVNVILIRMANYFAIPATPNDERIAMSTAVDEIVGNRESVDFPVEEIRPAFDHISNEAVRELAYQSFVLAHQSDLIKYELKSREETS